VGNILIASYCPGPGTFLKLNLSPLKSDVLALNEKLDAVLPCFISSY
jgi:hypothetical protein